MGVNKITWQEAGHIAQRIAMKAFEHIADPINQKHKATLHGVHTELIVRLDLCDVEKLVEAGVLALVRSVRMNFKANDGDADEAYVILNGDNDEEFVAPQGYYNQFYVRDQDLVAKLRAARTEYREFSDRVSSLAGTLSSQITGKSAKHVMKVWPEAAQIVADYFCIDVLTGADTKMTVPLEALLTQYLTPQLAAPQGV